MRRIRFVGGPGREGPPLRGREPRSRDLLNFAQRGPNVARSPSASAGRSAISTMCETRSTSPSGGGGSSANASASAPPLIPRRSVGHGHHAPPCGRKRASARARAPRVAFRPTAAFHHESTPGERPRADGRTLRPPHRARKRARSVADRATPPARARRPARAVCRSRGPRGAAALGGRASRAPPLEAVMRQESPGETRGAVRVLPGDASVSARDAERSSVGAGRRRADAAEPASERAAKIEHAEVEARRRLDEDASSCRFRCHARSAARGRADVLRQERHRLQLVRRRRSCPRSPAAGRARSR